MNVETLSAKHITMGFLDVLGELTEVDITPLEAIRKHSFIMSSMQGGCIFVAIEDNKVIGTAAIHILRKFVHNTGCVGLIEDVVVAENHRGKGVGKLLMDRVIEHAESYFVYKIILDCSLKNIPFYEKCGFHNHEYQMRMDLI